MEVGDLVQWLDHKGWPHGGLGFIVEIAVWKSGPAYKIMWHVDINDIDGYSGIWYQDEDFEDGTIVKV